MVLAVFSLIKSGNEGIRKEKTNREKQRKEKMKIERNEVIRERKKTKKNG
jgi:hypothetical protein